MEQLTWQELKDLEAQPLNETDETKVKEIAESIYENGWLGCPILIIDGALITGSHRLEALRMLEEEGNEYEGYVAADISEEIYENMIDKREANGDDGEEFGAHYYLGQYGYDNLAWLLKGTWAEEFKEELEW
jgi:hypothetical protein